MALVLECGHSLWSVFLRVLECTKNTDKSHCLEFIMHCRLCCGFPKQRKIMVGFAAVWRNSPYLWCRVLKLMLVTTYSSSSKFVSPSNYPTSNYLKWRQNCISLEGNAILFWRLNILETKALLNHIEYGARKFYPTWLWTRMVAKHGGSSITALVLRSEPIGDEG